MEANWSMNIVVAFATGIAIYIGRLLFKRWFNPLSVYSALWGFCLFNYELRLIQYYPISTAAWMYIGAAWVTLYLGAAAVLLASPWTRQPSPVQFGVYLNRLKQGVLFLSVVGAAGVIGQVIAVTRSFGSPIAALFLNPGDIYNARISNELSGLPYAGSFSLAACTLAGAHVAKSGKFTFATFLPIVLVGVQLAFLMGRGALGIGAILFLVTALHTPRDPGAKAPRWQLIVGAVLVAAF